MIKINQMNLPIEHSEGDFKKKIAKELKCSEERIISYKIFRRSIDARKLNNILFSYTVYVNVKNEKDFLKKCNNRITIESPTVYQIPIKVKNAPKTSPIIVGAGPAGLFCGYYLALAGLNPIIIERGKCIDERNTDVERFWKEGILNTESNVQFGEGGAGTFSDGKLNTLTKDESGRNNFVLETFIQAGAPKEILYDAKPHIGTDKLQTIVTKIRGQIEKLGGKVYFNSCLTGIVSEKNIIKEIEINHSKRIKCENLILALGHSARDTFFYLNEIGIKMEPKAFAVGFRIEHPQEIIDRNQYGKKIKTLGAAPYKVTAKTDSGRGVYSFCMCPGGYVVNSSSENKRLAINGMSYSSRAGVNSNSAMVITITPEDFSQKDVLGGIQFQRDLEERAYNAGNGSVPVMSYGDFKNKVINTKKTNNEKFKQSIPQNELECWNFPPMSPSIKGTWKMADITGILPMELNKVLVEGMEKIGKNFKGFNHDNALMEGIESRTSSPVRIIRDDNMECNLKGIYPCGEGAGYAGGIMSAAMDGLRVAENVLKGYNQ